MENETDPIIGAGKQTKPANENQTITLFDVFLVILRRKKLIIITTAISAAIAIAYSILSLVLPSSINYLPNKYTAEVILMLKSPSGDNNSAASSSISQLSSLVALAGIQTNSESDQNSNLILSLVKQNAFMDQLADEMEFNKRLKSRDPIEDTIRNRTTIKSRLKAKYDKDTGILSIRYSDADKEFSAKVVNRAVEILQKRFNDISLSYSQEKLGIIKDSIEKARINMETTQKTFTNFQKKYGFYDLTTSTSSSIGLIQSAQSDLLRTESSYKALSPYRDKSDPQLLRLSQQIAQQKEYIKSLKEGSPDLSGLNMTIGQMPDVAANYMILKQELTIQQSIYSSLRQQFESTQIEEISNAKIFSILEKAEVPLQKSGPSRGLICLIATMAGLFISVLAAFVLDYLQSVSVDPEEGLKMKESINLLKTWKNRR